MNFIKCRFCEWKTHKWGRGSNPAKAFARLAAHLEDEHEDHHIAIVLAGEKIEEGNDHNEYSLQDAP